METEKKLKELPNIQSWNNGFEAGKLQAQQEELEFLNWILNENMNIRGEKEIEERITFLSEALKELK